MESGISVLIDELLDTTAGRLEDVAEEAGVSYSALYSWATGRRRPSPENLERLASVAARRANRLANLADGLRTRLNGREAASGR
ncbi:MAG: helix-turn-helix transcriptional regulator [Longimicrobiales bacterium]